MRKNALLVFLFFFSWDLVPADAEDILTPAQGCLTTQLSVAPVRFTGNLDGPIGELTAMNWHLAQWGAPHPLSLVVNCLGNCNDGSWQTSSADGRQWATVFSGCPTKYYLQQAFSGSLFADCDEVDFFIEPNSAHAYPNFSEGMIPRAERPKLGQPAQYRVAWTQDLLGGFHGGRCGTNLSVYNTLGAVLFHNDVTDPERTLNHYVFYQLVSFDSRGFTFNGFWFQTSPGQGGWGVSDSVDVYGYTYDAVDGQPKTFDINFKDRLISLLQHNPYLPCGTIPGLCDANNWTPESPYFGSLATGEAAGHTAFWSIRVYAQ
ncbi:MAG TPA: hypothetical protein VGX03_01410 [Candidatus Binatia bacterium]|nr:hypothetical protein [Candidatus Binatia bacterium]